MAGKPPKKKKTKAAVNKKSSPTPKKKKAARHVKAKAPAPKKKKKKAAAPKKKKAASKKIEAMPSTERSPVTRPEAPPATPSERLLATRAQEPTERSLTDEEREAMMKVAETARKFVGALAGGDPSSIISSIARFLEDVRGGVRDEPRSQDVKLGLGVLWGEQLRAQVGWRWVHLTYPDGFASYALVPDDRAFACFPLNRIPEALRPSATNTGAHVFDSIRENTLPSRKPNAYLVIG